MALPVSLPSNFGYAFETALAAGFSDNHIQWCTASTALGFVIVINQVWSLVNACTVST